MKPTTYNTSFLNGFVVVLGYPFRTDICECFFFTLQIKNKVLTRSAKISQDLLIELFVDLLFWVARFGPSEELPNI